MHGFADRRIQESLFERNYPEPTYLERVHKKLEDDWADVEEVRSRTRGEAEVFQRALEQLVAQGAAVLEGYRGRVRRGDKARWRSSYAAQRRRRLAELEEMWRFTQGGTCRMCALVAHFGDHSDSHRPCGHCDVCAPESCTVRRFRHPTESEQQALWEAVGVLKERGELAKGALFRAMEGVGDRSRFEGLCDALTRGGLLAGRMETFEKDGQEIAYQRVWLTGDGEACVEGDFAGLWLDAEESTRGGRARRSQKRESEPSGPPPDADLMSRLRRWRAEEAETRSVPAYVVMSNRTMDNLARARPGSESDLRDVHGVGPKFIERYGAAMLSLLAES